LGPGARAPTPKTPIPNPQSPIPNQYKLSTYLYRINKIDLNIIKNK